MYCDHPACKKEVDINSVAVSQPKSAYTMFNEDGLGMTRVGGGNDNIVNVCKSCGHSEYLWESVEAMEIAAKKALEKNEEIKKYKEKNKGSFSDLMIFLFVLFILIIAFLILGIKPYWL